MRKGYTLTEMLIVLIIFPLALLSLNEVFKTLMRDIPRSSQVIQKNISLQNLLEQIHKDIDKAKGLPESFARYTTNDKQLLIELAEGTICYQLENDEALRGRLTDKPQGEMEETTLWSVPDAEIEWQLWKKDGSGYAVEIRTHIKHKLRRTYQKKMANSHVYFVGALGKALK